MASFKLEPDHISLNAPNIIFKRYMTYTRVIPWNWSAHRILEDVPSDVRHLVFNCHGYAERQNFKAPHLSLGTVIHPGNVDAFTSLSSIESLLVIWISSCSLASSSDGVEFCRSMARRSRCYVVSQAFAAPDVPLPPGHTDDNKNSMPYYIDPDGVSMGRSEFLSLGEDLGFAGI